jgi:enoyl-CoA hydratase/carnithine racemase
MDADAAASLGLVTQVVGDVEEREIKGKKRLVPALPRETFVDEVVGYAASFCAPGRPPLAVGHIKRAVQSGSELPLEYGLALERELQAKLFASDDAREGLAAFVEKRNPRFRGA